MREVKGGRDKLPEEALKALYNMKDELNANVSERVAY